MKKFLLCLPFATHGKYLKDKRRSGKTTKMFKAMLESDKNYNYVVCADTKRAHCLRMDFISVLNHFRHGNRAIYHTRNNEVVVGTKVFVFGSFDLFERQAVYHGCNIYIDELRDIVINIIRRYNLFRNFEHVQFISVSHYGK